MCRRACYIYRCGHDRVGPFTRCLNTKTPNGTLLRENGIGAAVRARHVQIRRMHYAVIHSAFSTRRVVFASAVDAPSVSDLVILYSFDHASILLIYYRPIWTSRRLHQSIRRHTIESYRVLFSANGNSKTVLNPLSRQVLLTC